MNSSTPYKRLEERFRRLSLIGDALSFLHWDWATVMPAGGAGGRSDQFAALEAIQHAILTDAETGDLLAAAEDEDGLDTWQAANLGEMRRARDHAAALPGDLVEAQVKAGAACETAWRQARPRDDFRAVKAPLSRVLELVRQAAAAKAEKLDLPPYDALLDQYEPAARSADIDRLFGELEEFLPGFLGEVLERQAAQTRPLTPEGPFPVEQQRALGVRLMEVLGFDFAHGRLDVSHHPFCGGTPEDLRITTRYEEGDFSSSLMAILHETGHALYDRGLPARWRGQPVGEARGMSIHESQSLLIEMQVCRGADFLAFAAPLMAEAFAGSGPAWTAENLTRLNTRVAPGHIRIDADEVTYPAHVILRYGLEKAMVLGGLEVGDLPGAWNDGMERLLGLRPPTDGEGCLQDIHWFEGIFGYFPSYTLGAASAAQIFAAAKLGDPTIAPAIGQGDFAPLLGWLGDNIHAKASLLSTRDLLKEATGRPLALDAFKAHLKARYLA